MSGLPEIRTSFAGFDSVGSFCRISSSVSVLRRCGSGDSSSLVSIGDGTVLFDNVRLVVCGRDECSTAGVSIGRNVLINVGGYLSGEGGLILEDYVLLGPYVRILSAGHSVEMEHECIQHNLLTYAPITIGKGAWIGAGSTILQGRSIGEGAVVGAASVVTKNVPPFCVVVGNPARVVRFRKDSRRSGWCLRKLRALFSF